MAHRDVEVETVDAIAYRYSSYDTPFWARENTEPGSWHVRGHGPTQYLAMSTDGAWAELIRNEELRTEDEVALVSVPMWAVRVDQAMVVDYSTFQRAETAAFDPAALVDEDHRPCQREGARLRALGYSGILAPSAALEDGVNLTLSGTRMASAWGRPPLLASSLPATIITKGAPPPGLLPRVRKIGPAPRLACVQVGEQCQAIGDGAAEDEEA
jgi:RES domain-containing protein